MSGTRAAAPYLRSGSQHVCLSTGTWTGRVQTWKQWSANCNWAPGWRGATGATGHLRIVCRFL